MCANANVHARPRRFELLLSSRDEMIEPYSGLAQSQFSTDASRWRSTRRANPPASPVSPEGFVPAENESVLRGDDQLDKH